MGPAPLMSSAQWYWPGRPPLPDAHFVVATAEAAAQATALLVALKEATAKPFALLLLDEGPYHGPLPWLRLPGLRPRRVLARLKARSLLCLVDGERVRALAAAANCPVVWVNGRSRDLLTLGQVCVASRAVADHIGGGTVTGDPLVTWSPSVTTADAGFCGRFAAVRTAGRFILYFGNTVAGDETVAYQTFLGVRAGAGGLLALAPHDPTRHEGVYRDAIKYHLQTVRQTRLMTSEVPAKTRVYYIESPAARQAMYACADVIVVGGTFTDTPAPPLDEGIWCGTPLVLGPYPKDARLAAAQAALVAATGPTAEAVAAEVQALLADPDLRARRSQAWREWLTLQGTAQARFVTWFQRFDASPTALP